MSMDVRGPADESEGSPSLPVKVLKAIVLAVAAIGLSAMSVALVAISVGGDEPLRAGADDHGPLRPGARISVRTVAGTEAEVLVRSVHGGATAPEIAVTVKGAAERALQPNAWTFQLDDGNEMAAHVAPANRDLVLRPAGGIPAGRVPRFLRFDPDDSRGDMYFEFQ